MTRLVLIIAALILAACGGRPPPHPDDEPRLEVPVRSPLTGAAPGEACAVGDVIYPVGARFTAEDGCNTCTCTADGPMCTKMACPSRARKVIRFVRGSAAPPPEAMMLLASLKQLLAESTASRAFVLGHATDAERRVDPELPQRRADAVAARLRSLGVPAHQIEARIGDPAHGQPEVLFKLLRR